MPLSESLLKQVKRRDGKLVAQCPACAESGGDSQGVHLVVYPDGRFGCAAVPNDKNHRRRIAELVGDRTLRTGSWTLKLGGKLVMASGEAGTPIASLARGKSTAANPSGKQASAASVVPQEITKTDGPDASFPYIAYSKNPKCSTCTKGNECIGGIYGNSASAASDDLVACAIRLFNGKARYFKSGMDLPPSLAEVVRHWPHNPPNDPLPPERPRLIGWKRSGQPVYASPPGKPEEPAK